MEAKTRKEVWSDLGYLKRRSHQPCMQEKLNEKVLVLTKGQALDLMLGDWDEDKLDEVFE